MTPAGTTAVAPASHGTPCSADADCGANHTGGLCMPKASTTELADAEDFLGRAMSLHDLVTRLGDSSSTSQMATILQHVQDDLTTYSQIASGRAPAGADAGGGTSSVAPGAPLTNDEAQRRQDAAWLQSGATQAYFIIRQFAHALSTSPVKTDAQQVYADMTGDGAGLHLDKVIGDLQTFLRSLEAVVAPVRKLADHREPDGGVPGLRTGVGALIHYLAPVLEAIRDATSSVDAALDPSGTAKLENELAIFSRAHDAMGKDGNLGTCLETAWQPSQAGLSRAAP